MKSYFEEILNTKIKSIETVSGGNINEAYKITTNDNTIFAKVSQNDFAKKNFQKESLGLSLLSVRGKLSVPKVLGTYCKNNYSFLLLEWIDEGIHSHGTSESIAKQLCRLHSISSNKFGLEIDNYIGTLNQVNTQANDWLSFYYTNRVEYQLKHAIDSNFLSKTLIKKTDNMFRNIGKDFPEISPALLHGDLWNGNYTIDAMGNPIFFDPAAYYGDKEIDYAMMRLFGGFNEKVFSIIDEQLPFTYGWQSRVKFYQLYYILVHVNLFGLSYANSAVNILNYYGG